MYTGGSDTVTVEYSVKYLPQDEHYYICGVSQPPIPNPVSVVVPAGSTAFEVIENAVNQFGSSYKFTATYFYSMGYFINAINDVPYTITNHPPSRCFWKFIVQYPNGTEVAPDVGVSTFTFNSDGYGMIMSYQDVCPGHPSREPKKLKEEL